MSQNKRHRKCGQVTLKELPKVAQTDPDTAGRKWHKRPPKTQNRPRTQTATGSCTNVARDTREQVSMTVMLWHWRRQTIGKWWQKHYTDTTLRDLRITPYYSVLPRPSSLTHWKRLVQKCRGHDRSSTLRGTWHPCTAIFIRPNTSLTVAQLSWSTCLAQLIWSARVFLTYAWATNRPTDTR